MKNEYVYTHHRIKSYEEVTIKLSQFIVCLRSSQVEISRKPHKTQQQQKYERATYIETKINLS